MHESAEGIAANDPHDPCDPRALSLHNLVGQILEEAPRSLRAG
jgi:hypothetical protein